MFGGRKRIEIAIALGAGLLVGAVCWFVLSSDGAQRFDRRLTLSWLYGLRGERPSPASVVVIEMNSASGGRLSLPADARERSRCSDLLIDMTRPGYRPLGSPDDSPWPRCVHGRLVDALHAAGARTIVFDVAFVDRLGRDDREQEDIAEEDRQFAVALHNAGNVLVADQVAYVPCRPGADECAERSAKPLSPVVRDAAAATGPMLLEHSSGALVDSYLMFREGGDPMVTLPLLAWHLGRPEAHDQLNAWLATQLPEDQLVPPLSGATRFEPGELVGAGLYFRAVLRELGPRRLKRGGIGGQAARMRELYGGPYIRLLNEYGPARVLASLGYAEALKLAQVDVSRLTGIVAGKTVFIGYAERYEKTVIEQFPTHFSTPTEVDPSGVDLMATAYANLDDGSSLRFFGDAAAIAAVAGFAATAVCLIVPAFWGLGVVVLGLLGFLALAAWGFSARFVVLPMLAPLVGAMIGFSVALAWQYLTAARQRRRVFDRLCQFVPANVARQLASPAGIVPESVEGICLVTDATGYTSLAEQVESRQLVEQLNRYYAHLFRPVLDHGGFVNDVIGDSMMAVWPHRAGATAPIAQVMDACLSILNELDSADPGVAMPTRIGVAAGPMTLTMVGALTHFEYRAVGDMVNVANRVQALNKLLGTRVLVREEVAHAATDFVFRDLGVFRLPGKEAPQRIYELVGRVGAIDEARLRFMTSFESARRLEELGDLEGARRGLEALGPLAETDGPTRYHLDRIARQTESSRPAFESGRNDNR